jgi:hypothetical protein
LLHLRIEGYGAFSGLNEGNGSVCPREARLTRFVPVIYAFVLYSCVF